MENPFDDESFDGIFHPATNCYVEKVDTIFKECYRVLKKGGIFLGGYDLGINYVFDDEEKEMIYTLSFNPLKNPQHYQDSMKNDWGIAFSHTLEEQIGGSVKGRIYFDRFIRRHKQLRQAIRKKSTFLCCYPLYKIKAKSREIITWRRVRYVFDL